jgi:hypothetical protein
MDFWVDGCLSGGVTAVKTAKKMKMMAEDKLELQTNTSWQILYHQGTIVQDGSHL